MGMKETPFWNDLKRTVNKTNCNYKDLSVFLFNGFTAASRLRWVWLWKPGVTGPPGHGRTVHVFVFTDRQKLQLLYSDWVFCHGHRSGPGAVLERWVALLVLQVIEVSPEGRKIKASTGNDSSALCWNTSIIINHLSFIIKSFIIIQGFIIKGYWVVALWHLTPIYYPMPWQASVFVWKIPQVQLDEKESNDWINIYIWQQN